MSYHLVDHLELSCRSAIAIGAIMPSLDIEMMMMMMRHVNCAYVINNLFIRIIIIIHILIIVVDVVEQQQQQENTLKLLLVGYQQTNKQTWGYCRVHLYRL